MTSQPFVRARTKKELDSLFKKWYGSFEKLKKKKRNKANFKKKKYIKTLVTVRTQQSTFHFPYMVCLRLGVHLSIPKADVHINPLQRTFRDLDSPRVCEAKCPANLKPRRLRKRGLKEPPPTSLLCLNSLKSRNSKRRSI